MGFDLITKRLRYMGHILNLITESYFFGQDKASQKDNFKKAGPGERRKLWRQRGELRKLYNLVTHVINSSKCIDLFIILQIDANTGKAISK